MPKQSLGNGVGGKSFEERELAKRVRNLTLTQMEKILRRPDANPLKQALILKLASTVLPRLTELSGPDGGPVHLEGVEVTLRRESQL